MKKHTQLRVVICAKVTSSTARIVGRAATSRGVSVSAFVRQAVLRAVRGAR